MIDQNGNVRVGPPRKGKEVVEYQRVKADIVEMLHQEIPDREIAARLGLSRSGFYQLKKRILKEVIPNDIGMSVAAREYMRLDRQMQSLIRYMDACWAAGDPPDASYITAFTNLSRRLADLVGANAAIQIQVDHGGEGEEQAAVRDHHLAMAQELNRFYELQDRLAMRNGNGTIGSGLTKEERDREMDNLRLALPAGEDVRPADYGLDDDDSDDPDIEDAVELIEVERGGWDDDPEHIYIDRVTRAQARQAERHAAGNIGDQETPGRWVAGKFVSWWHDLGDATPENYADFDPPEPPDASMECDDGG